MPIPTVEEIREYLEKYNPLGLAGAPVMLINVHNHVNFQVGQYCLRIINPESPRAREWLSIPGEYTLLKLIEASGLGPKSHYVDPERFGIPLIIQDFAPEVTCFKDLLPLTDDKLVATAHAIALLNSQNVTPENFPFQDTRYSYLTSVRTWRTRLAEIKKSCDKEVLEWAEKIEAVVNRAENILEGFEPLLEKACWAFNFDGGHIGNTYWKNRPGPGEKRVIFLDWQKVSFGDPAFTLARFLTSTAQRGEEIPQERIATMTQEYLRHWEVPDFAKLVEQRLFERQVADLVWVLWNFVRAGRAESLEKVLSVKTRYQTVQKLLEQY